MQSMPAIVVLNYLSYVKRHSPSSPYLPKNPSSLKAVQDSSLWYNYKVGRITASKLHTVAKYTERSYPTSHLKSVMHYSAPPPNIPALRWGCEKEETAIADYTSTMACSHTNLKLEWCGLIVNPKYPHLGASPDGLTFA